MIDFVVIVLLKIGILEPISFGICKVH